jgi:hypothetical protein
MKYEHNGEVVSPCRACGTPIWFFKTKLGKFLPINRETGEPHFADCPSANDFRKPRTGPKQGREVRFKGGTASNS